MARPPESKYAADRHSYRWEDGTEVRLERFTEKGDSVSALLTATLHQNGAAPRLLKFGNLNLLSPTTRASFAKSIGDPKLWNGRLEEVCYLSVIQYREGTSPFVDLATVTVSEDDPMLWPPLVTRDGISLLYGDGEAGKSLLTIAGALSIATGIDFLGLPPMLTGPVLYLDWEDIDETHTERARALCAGLAEPVEFERGWITHRRMDTSLPAAVDRIRREVEEGGFVLVIIDSLGLARGDDPISAEATIRTLSACRSLGCPVWIIDHISAEQRTGKVPKDKSFGSIYTRNQSRVAWLVEKVEEEGSDEFVIRLRNTKVNRGRRRKSFGYRVEIENGAQHRMVRATYHSTDVTAIREFQRTSSNKDRLVAVLRENRGVAYPPSQLAIKASEQGKAMSEATVRTTLNRHPETFVVVKDGDGERFWGLLEHRHGGP